METAVLVRQPRSGPSVPPQDHPGSRPLSDLGLSPRELEIARLICRGLSNKEIAQFLQISHHTVSAHIRRIFDKLQINRHAHLAVFVAERLHTGRSR